MSSKVDLSRGSFTKIRYSTTYDFISPLKLDLFGKSVQITIAAFEDGIGYSTALAFARAGEFHIAIADLHNASDTLISNLRTAATHASRDSPSISSYAVDISNLSRVTALHTSISASFKIRLDILINNAAHMEPVQTFLDSEPSDYWRAYEVNPHGLFSMARIFLSTLLSAQNGLCTMLNLSSSGALSARPRSILVARRNLLSYAGRRHWR
jgi:NAD(P)-dependent dehydrogenase (short-subunit alcohol dehydrogenase family)